MRIYIAGSSQDVDRAEAAVKAARAYGLEVTFDWTVGMKPIRESYPTDREAPRQLRQAAKKGCVRGVVDADVLWLLSPTAPTIGAWVELGMALYAAAFDEMTVVVSGSIAPTSFLEPCDPDDACIVLDAANVFATDDLALARLVEMAGGAP